MPKIHCSMDWGRLDNFAWHAHYLYEENWNGLIFNRIITFKEVSGGNNLSPHEQVERIAPVIDYTKTNITYYDNSMKTPQADSSMSVIDQFDHAWRAKGIRVNFQPGTTKRKAGWVALDNWMRIAPDGLPYWLIYKGCKELIRTIPLLVPKENDIDDLEKCDSDHWIDCCSYCLVHQKWIDAKAKLIQFKDKFDIPSRKSFMVDKKGQIPAIKIKDFIGEPDKDWRLR